MLLLGSLLPSLSLLSCSNLVIETDDGLDESSSSVVVLVSVVVVVGVEMDERSGRSSKEDFCKEIKEIAVVRRKRSMWSTCVGIRETTDFGESPLPHIRIIFNANESPMHESRTNYILLVAD
jgi:hypothetical protein